MTSSEIIAADALRRAVEWVRGQIARDRENRYSLLRDWQLPAAFCSFWPADVGGWETDLLRIERVASGIVRVTVKAYHSTAADNICDGATLSPDSLPGILPAALFHDPWYYKRAGGVKSFEALAELLGVKPRTARQFGDALFYSIARAGGCSWLVAQLYYLGIRVGYPIVKPFICAALVALLAGGCAGCIGAGDDGTFVDPSQFTPPAWEQVQ